MTDRITRRDVLAGGVAVLGSVLFAGYGGNTKGPSKIHGTFVGRIAGTEAFVGIDSDEGRLTVYVCDGRDGHISINEWFHTPVRSGQISVRNADGAKLRLRPAAPGARGTIELPGGEQLSFRAHPAGKGEFFAHKKKDGRNLGSVIIDGQSRGKVGALPAGCWCQTVYTTRYLVCNAQAPVVVGKC